MLKTLNCTEYIKNKLYKIYKKTLAFTLAETLIVMGVIGVVAALTLPNLNQSTGDKEKVAKVKKIYQNLNDAYGRAVAVYGPYDEWFVNDTTNEAKAKRASERITEFMKISKNCGYEDGCFTTTDVLYCDQSKSYKIILADGSGMMFCTFALFPIMYTDIDGPNRGKNKTSEDIFAFMPNNSDLSSFYPDGYSINLSAGKFFDLSCCRPGSDGRGTTCTFWVIDYGNMDYLKADTKGKCPDGKTILDGVSNTTCN